MSNKQNIIWFVADQMRKDTLAHMGNPAAVTPNIDSLAKDGVSFSNAYCQNPVCVPSRCSFLTGLYPHTTGHRTMHYLMRQDEPNILKTMKENGYEVIWIGRNDVLPANVSKKGYCDRYYNGVDLENHVDDSDSSMKKALSSFKKIKPEISPVMENVNNKYSFYTGKYPQHSLDNSFDWNCIKSALKFLEERKNAPTDKPFFLYCTLMFPHPPYGCEEPWYSLIDRNKLPPRRPNVETLNGKAKMLYNIRGRQKMDDWTEAQYNELRAVYLGMTARFDHQLGMITDQLKESKMYDNTNIFLFSDHGDYTGDYGIAEKCQNCFEDTLTNVPLVVKLAKDIPSKNGINTALVELLDLPATICDIAGIDIGYNQFGKSLLGTIKTGECHKDYVICEGGRLPDEWQAMEPLHEEGTPYWPRISVQHMEDGSHYKGCMIREKNIKYIMRINGEDELYDLENDPMELNNCINDASFSDKVLQLREKLLLTFVKTSDYVPPAFDKR